jgi:hypothetical protein
MEVYEWLSLCCDAMPAIEVDESTIPYGGPIGYCSHCEESCGFYEGEREE